MGNTLRLTLAVAGLAMTAYSLYKLSKMEREGYCAVYSDDTVRFHYIFRAS